MKITQRRIQNPRLSQLYKDIQEDLAEVEKLLKLFTLSSNAIISEISAYLFQKAGKRIRPAILLLCSKVFGYQGKEQILMSALVETIHTASLIHDDIIDNSTMRRGRETVHARWGPNITVLLGDYLYIKTIGLSLQSEHREVIQILTETSSQMIEGELDEYYLSGNLEIEERDYLDIIGKKTASLFAAACLIGGVLGQASVENRKNLAEIGRNIGLSFQIIDDLLDYTGDEKKMGKPILSDLSEGRITLPLIYTLRNDNGRNHKRIMELMKNRQGLKASTEEILEIIRSNGALDYTFKKAEDLSRKSKEIISRLPESSYQQALSLLPDYILTRNT